MIDLKSLSEQVKAAVPLAVAMEAAGVDFTSKSGDAWKAHCFLHDDPGPSLVVSPNKGLFNCFSTGCIARGDVISFHQMWHNVGFSEAVRQIAVDWALASADELEIEGDASKARLISVTIGVLDELSKFLLKDKQAAHIRAYMKKRGVSSETVSAFKVGYSPSCDFAERIAKKLGASEEEIKSLQFNRPSLFGGKIVLPVICPRRTGVFYYGTSIDRTGPGPKYMGATAEHPLRWKGPVFGLQGARAHIRKAKTLVVVEGFFDALALHSAGLKHTVSVLGANVTAEQFEALKSYSVPSVTVLFDGDRGGDAGIHQVIKSASGVRTHVAFIPEGDPDDYVMRFGLEALESVIEQSISPIDFLINEAAADFDGGSVYQKSDRMLKLLEAVRAMPAHEGAVAVAEVARLSGLPVDIVQDLLNQVGTTLDNPVESERIVLAGAMQSSEQFIAAEMRVGTRAVWSVQRNRVVWEAMVAARKKDATLLTPEVLKAEIGDRIKLEGMLEDLETTPANNYDYHLNAVCDAAVRRGLQSASKQLFGDAANRGKALQDIVAKHMTALAIASTTKTQVEFTAREQVRGAMEYLQEQMSKGGKFPGLSLGAKWRSLDEVTLGFQPGYTYLLSALPKVGKSNTAMNWNLELAVEQNIPTLWLNGEMSERDLALRNLSILSGISSMRIRRGAISAKEKEIIDAAAVRYHASPLHVVNSAGMTVHDAINAMRKAVYSDGVKCVFLDYIQLLRGTSTLSYWERHMEISTELKAAVSRLPVPLIAISQQSKASMTSDGGASNQGGSFKYVQDCDIAMDLRRRTDKEMVEDGSGNLVLSIDFNRHGPQDVFAKLLFNTDNLRVEEI